MSITSSMQSPPDPVAAEQGAEHFDAGERLGIGATSSEMRIDGFPEVESGKDVEN